MDIVVYPIAQDKILTATALFVILLEGLIYTDGMHQYIVVIVVYKYLPPRFV